MSMKKGISLFTVSFKQGFMSPNIPIASFKQGDKDINFLLDTGSDNNLIDATALKQFEHEMYDEELVEKVNLTGVGGDQQVKACKLTFSCEGKNYTQNFLVADIHQAFDRIKIDHCITIHGILGSVFLREHSVVLDFKNLSAYTKK